LPATGPSPSLTHPEGPIYRELYLLTPAERETGGHSNRFAAHVLAYPQVQALMKERGWHGTQLGSWDGGQDAQLYLEFAKQCDGGALPVDPCH
jgi:hypothetical protein